MSILQTNLQGEGCWSPAVIGSSITKDEEVAPYLIKIPLPVALNMMVQCKTPESTDASGNYSLHIDYHGVPDVTPGYTLSLDQGIVSITGVGITPVAVAVDPGSSMGLARISNQVYFVVEGLVALPINSEDPASLQPYVISIEKDNNLPLLGFQIGTQVGVSTIDTLRAASVFVREVEGDYTIIHTTSCEEQEDTTQLGIEPVLGCAGHGECVTYVERPEIIEISVLSCDVGIDLCTGTISHMPAVLGGVIEHVILVTDRGYLSDAMTQSEIALLFGAYSYGCGIQFVTLQTTDDEETYIEDRGRGNNTLNLIVLNLETSILKMYRHNGTVPVVVLEKGVSTPPYMSPASVSDTCTPITTGLCSGIYHPPACRVAVISTGGPAERVYHEDTPLGSTFIYTQGIGVNSTVRFGTSVVPDDNTIYLELVFASGTINIAYRGSTIELPSSHGDGSSLRIVRAERYISIYIDDILVFRDVFSSPNYTTLYVSAVVGNTATGVLNDPRINGAAVRSWLPSATAGVEEYHCSPEDIAGGANRVIMSTGGRSNNILYTGTNHVYVGGRHEVFMLDAGSAVGYVDLYIENTSFIPATVKVSIAEQRNPNESHVIIPGERVGARQTLIIKSEPVAARERIHIETEEEVNVSISSVQEGKYLE